MSVILKSQRLCTCWNSLFQGFLYVFRLKIFNIIKNKCSFGATNANCLILNWIRNVYNELVRLSYKQLLRKTKLKILIRTLHCFTVTKLLRVVFSRSNVILSAHYVSVHYIELRRLSLHGRRSSIAKERDYINIA